MAAEEPKESVGTSARIGKEDPFDREEPAGFVAYDPLTGRLQVDVPDAMTQDPDVREGRVRVKQKFDTQATVIYVGWAALGTATSAAAWTIKKVDLDGSGNPTTATWTAEASAVWDDRATESYS